MTKRLALLAVLALAAAAPARADGPEPIETRQAGQDLLAGTYAGVRAVVATKGDVKPVEASAKAMARWMRQFPSQFPLGTEQGHDTKALPAVWSDRAGFAKAAGEFAGASDKLAQLARDGDADGVANQTKVVGEACGACHRNYKAR